MELLDKNGLTEREFLEQYNPAKYARPSFTADILLVSDEKERLEVLLIRRGGHPYLGYWAMPGGFVNPNETVDAAAARELEEETHVTGLPLCPLMLCSAPNRDPRTWTISQAYLSVVRRSTLHVQADDDASQADWFSVVADFRDGRGYLTLDNGKGVVLRAIVRVSFSDTAFGRVYDLTVDCSEGIAFDHAAVIVRGILKLQHLK